MIDTDECLRNMELTNLGQGLWPARSHMQIEFRASPAPSTFASASIVMSIPSPQAVRDTTRFYCAKQEWLGFLTLLERRNS